MSICQKWAELILLFEIIRYQVLMPKWEDCLFERIRSLAAPEGGQKKRKFRRIWFYYEQKLPIAS